MSDSIIDQLMQTITPKNIDKKLLFYSAILERLVDRKECYDINISKSFHPRACKITPRALINMYKLDVSSDDDDSDDSDYIPSEDSEDE